MSARSEENHPHPPADWMFSRFWARIILLSLVLAIAGGVVLFWWLPSLRLTGPRGIAAVDAIIAADPPNAGRELKTIIDNSWNDLDIRCYAITAIGQLQNLPPAARIALLMKYIEGTSDGEQEACFREAAILGLGAIPGKSARQTLVKLTHDRVGDDRNNALVALRYWIVNTLWQSPARRARTAHLDADDPAWQTELSNFLNTIIRDDKDNVEARSSAVSALGALQTDECVEELFRYAKDQTLDSNIRSAAIQVMEDINRPQVLDRFKELQTSLTAEPELLQSVKEAQEWHAVNYPEASNPPADEEGENGDEADGAMNGDKADSAMNSAGETTGDRETIEDGANVDGSAKIDGSATVDDGATVNGSVEVDGSQAENGEPRSTGAPPAAVAPPTASGGE